MPISLRLLSSLLTKSLHYISIVPRGHWYSDTSSRPKSFNLKSQISTTTESTPIRLDDFVFHSFVCFINQPDTAHLHRTDRARKNNIPLSFLSVSHRMSKASSPNCSLLVVAVYPKHTDQKSFRSRFSVCLIDHSDIFYLRCIFCS